MMTRKRYTASGEDLSHALRQCGWTSDDMRSRPALHRELRRIAAYHAAGREEMTLSCEEASRLCTVRYGGETLSMLVMAGEEGRPHEVLLLEKE